MEDGEGIEEDAADAKARRIKQQAARAAEEEKKKSLVRHACALYNSFNERCREPWGQRVGVRSAEHSKGKQPNTPTPKKDGIPRTHCSSRPCVPSARRCCEKERSL